MSGIEDAQVAVQREIDLLHEYRTRLIADVVTGKLDVRQSAANPLGETDAHEELDAVGVSEGVDEDSCEKRNRKT